MGFQEQILLDMQNIVESNEFFSIHNIDGRDLNIMIDEEELKEKQESKSDNTNGLYLNIKLFYVASNDYGKELPAIGTSITLDDIFYLVTDAIEQYGMYIITLGVNAT